MASDDPMSQVYRRLWQILESHDPFAVLVRPGNRIRSMAGSGGGKPSLQPADLPQVRIVPAGGAIDLFQTSTSSAINQDYAIAIRTGDRMTDDRLLAIKWEIIRAFAGQDDTLGIGSIAGVERARLRGPTASASVDPWKTVLVVAVRFRFATAGLAD